MSSLVRSKSSYVTYGIGDGGDGNGGGDCCGAGAGADGVNDDGERDNDDRHDSGGGGSGDGDEDDFFFLVIIMVINGGGIYESANVLLVMVTALPLLLYSLPLLRGHNSVAIIHKCAHVICIAMHI